MKIGGFENRTDTERGCLELILSAPEEGGVSAGRLRQPQQHPQSGRFPGAVGSEETSNGSGFNVERQVVDGKHLPVSLRKRHTLNDVGHVYAFANGDEASLPAVESVIVGEMLPRLQSEAHPHT